MTAERWAKLKEFLDRTLDQPTQARQELLASWCKSDPDLKREVERLVEENGPDSVARFLENPIVDPAHLLSAIRIDAVAFKPGAILVERFRINAIVGRGGMGEVYRGTDLRLNRTVAIKIVSEEVSTVADLRQRFDREARILSGLAHPNICSLYDLCHDEHGPSLLIMEFLEGETLNERLRRGPVPLEQCIAYAVDITRALQYAHEKGVIHRDLKPSNVMITPLGAKLLDFGLARFLSQLSDSAAELLEPEGRPAGPISIVGTPRYMAAEQWKGQADTRTDLFSLGILIYEMSTGHEIPRVGNSGVPGSESVDLDHLPSTGLPALDRIIRKCLANDRKDRWRTAEDLECALQVLADSRPWAARPLPRGTRSILQTAGIAIAFGLLAAAVLLSTRGGFRTASAPAVRFLLPPPGGSYFGSLENDGPMVVSPDGRWIAFVAVQAGVGSRLWIRAIDSTSVETIPGTNGAQHPFWSPDSQLIGFFADGQMKTTPLTGGGIRIICSVREGRGASWSKNGTILFSPGFTDSLYRVPAGGGKVEPVTQLDFAKWDNSHRWPFFLPDSQHFLFFVRSGHPDRQGVYLGDLSGRIGLRIGDCDSAAQYYAPSDGGNGYLLCMQGHSVTARVFDASKETVGAPVSIAEAVAGDLNTTAPPFSVSATGVLTYGGSEAASSRLTWFDRQGNELDTVGNSNYYRYARLSPDGNRIIAERLNFRTGTGDLWMIDLRQGVTSRATVGPESNLSPIWSPDGNTIVFTSNRDNRAAFNLYQKQVGSAQPDEPLVRADEPMVPTDWSPNGRTILYQTKSQKTGWDLGVLTLGGERRAHTILGTPADEFQGQFSADGNWIVYTSNQSGENEVYIKELAGSRSLQVSVDGGSQPRWRPHSNAVYYIDRVGRLMLTEVRLGTNVVATRPRPLFQTPLRPGLGVIESAEYNVAADGMRFLLYAPPIDVDPLPAVVLVNWASRITGNVR